MKKENFKKGEIIIYKTSKNEVSLDVRLEEETVWLNLNQLGILFDTDKSGISRHIKNIYKDGELDKKATVAIFATVQKEGERIIKRDVEFYNLDTILSIGYRVNSKQAAKILNLLSDYAKTLTILEQYDKGQLKESKGGKTKFVLKYDDCLKIIAELKKELVMKKEASDLFGNERDGSFEGIIKGLYQSFGGKELYPSIEDKASHLLYFIIKDHPFSDGNKRSAAFLFVYFLDKTNFLFKKSGERKINDNALAALALLVAESDPKEKETMVKIIKNLLVE